MAAKKKAAKTKAKAKTKAVAKKSAAKKKTVASKAAPKKKAPVKKAVKKDKSVVTKSRAPQGRQQKNRGQSHAEKGENRTPACSAFNLLSRRSGPWHCALYRETGRGIHE